MTTAAVAQAVGPGPASLAPARAWCRGRGLGPVFKSSHSIIGCSVGHWQPVTVPCGRLPPPGPGRDLPLARAPCDCGTGMTRTVTRRAARPGRRCQRRPTRIPIRLTRTQVIMITRVAVHDSSGPVITESLERPGRRPSRLPLAVTLSGSHGSKFCPARDGVCARRPGHHSLAASARLGARARPEKLEP